MGVFFLSAILARRPNLRRPNTLAYTYIHIETIISKAIVFNTRIIFLSSLLLHYKCLSLVFYMAAAHINIEDRKYIRYQYNKRLSVSVSIHNVYTQQHREKYKSEFLV